MTTTTTSTVAEDVAALVRRFAEGSIAPGALVREVEALAKAFGVTVEALPLPDAIRRRVLLLPPGALRDPALTARPPSRWHKFRPLKSKTRLHRRRK